MTAYLIWRSVRRLRHRHRDADFTLNRLYACAAKRMGYCNKDLDSILTKARASLDQNERKTLYAQADKILWADAAGIFPVDLKNNHPVPGSRTCERDRCMGTPTPRK